MSKDIPLFRSLGALLGVADCSSPWVALLLHPSARVNAALLLSAATAGEAAGAALIYGDFALNRGAERVLCPTIEYQEGSLRADFAFGGVVLLRTEYVLEYLRCCPEHGRYTFAEWYALRLFLSRKGRIMHVPEVLAEGNGDGEGPLSQFDYVDPANRSAQDEYELAVSYHLQKIGALVSADTLAPVTPAGPYPVTASVIIPVRNRRATIGAAIRSALSQTTTFDYNIIVVDNHSSDGTDGVVRALAQEDRRVIPLVPAGENRGIGGCWNSAITSKYCGRYAVQLDSDDLYAAEHVLQTIVATFENTRAAMVVGAYRLCDYTLRTLPPGVIAHREWSDSNGANNLLRVNGIGAPRAFVTSILRQRPFPDVSYGEDYAAALYISGRYKVARIYDELYLCRRWNDNSDAHPSLVETNQRDYFKDQLRTLAIRERQEANRQRREREEREPIDVETLYVLQREQWTVCRDSYARLEGAQTRTLAVEGRAYTLSFNPLRAKETREKVQKGKGDERPCFLCKARRPRAQRFITVSFATTKATTKHTYHLCVNPFPIVDKHFTIIAARHCRQRLTPARLYDMQLLAERMKGYLLFFNGATAGASAPAHLHFQAVPQSAVPLLQWSEQQKERLFIQQGNAADIKIDYTQEAMTNVLCWHDDSGTTRWIVVRRHRHRPAVFYEEGEKQVLISPAAVEYAGLIPLVREEDYHKMTPQMLGDILHECYNNEPLVDVGLCPSTVPAQRQHNGTTTIRGIHIGRTFHWEQPMTLTFAGTMFVREDKATGEKWRVNRLSAERYLTAVVAAEMAAANIPLLKAQAVVARSWLVRQMTHKERTPLPQQKEGQILRWYDSKGHSAFDVCGDDHCQRYQGIGISNYSALAKIVAETQGEVLVYNGEVVDARFSKCCGGRTEEYASCWENIDVPYLHSVADTRPDGSVYCNTHDKGFLQHVLNAYDLSTCDFGKWQVTYTQDEVSTLVEEKQRAGIGRITALVPLSRGTSGRIITLRIVGERGEIIIGKELEIRRTLSKTHLYSSAFDVSTSLTSEGTLLFTLRGKGWGHGVGLCQIGAAVRGNEGQDYTTILAAYYPGTTIERLW